MRIDVSAEGGMGADSRCCTTGTKKARVFPVPVLA